MTLIGGIDSCVLIGRRMISGIEQVKERLQELDEEIAETMRRLPAHSIKPPVMMDLLELEDERDLLLKKLGAVTS